MLSRLIISTFLLAILCGEGKSLKDRKMNYNNKFPYKSGNQIVNPVKIQLFLTFCTKSQECHTLYYQQTKNEGWRSMEPPTPSSPPPPPPPPPPRRNEIWKAFEKTSDEDEILSPESSQHAVYSQRQYQPQFNYYQSINEQSAPRSPKETTVYVLPQKNTHTYDVKGIYMPNMEFYNNYDSRDRISVVHLEQDPYEVTQLQSNNLVSERQEISYSSVQKRYTITLK